MVRPESTRHAIIKAPVDLFADKGFEGASVRDIVTKARVNQAAITPAAFEPQEHLVPSGAWGSLFPLVTRSLWNFSSAS